MSFEAHTDAPDTGEEINDVECIAMFSANGGHYRPDEVFLKVKLATYSCMADGDGTTVHCMSVKLGILLLRLSSCEFRLDQLVQI